MAAASHAAKGPASEETIRGAAGKTRSWAARAVPLLAGFSAAVGQIVLMREVIALFNGNELSLGIVLGCWLAWTAAGSCLPGWLVRKATEVRRALAVTEWLCGISLPVSVVALREARVVLQTVPGEPFGPVRITVVCLVCVSLFCLASGGLFTLAARLTRETSGVLDGSETSRIYLLDTVGFALGGIAASLMLLRWLGCMQMACMVTLLCACVGITLYIRLAQRQLLELMAGAVLIGIPMLFLVAPRVETATLARLWPGFELRDVRESLYGRLVVLDSGGMRAIYDNGSLLANIPDSAAAEESVHYALLEHPAPKNILLIGGGVNGSIAEALKHPSVERVDYVEIDPVLIEIARGQFPEHVAPVISNPRVHVHLVDGRYFLQSSQMDFDVIVVSALEPGNGELNRFYTTEFFRSARGHLAQGGLLALELHGAEDYVSPQLAAFLRCIHRTLGGVFPEIVAIPGESFHFFASMRPGALTSDPQVLVSRLRERKVQTQYVREYFLPFRMSAERMDQIARLLQFSGDGVSANDDFRPAAYYFSTVLWSAQFGHGYAGLLERTQELSFWKVVVALGGVSMVGMVLLSVRHSQRKRAKAIAVSCVAMTGFTLMALQLLLLFLFQSLQGYVYQQLAMLLGMFMAGIAAGAWWGMRQAEGGRDATLLRKAAIGQSVLAASAPLLVAVAYVAGLSLHPGAGHVAIQIAFPLLAFVAGVPGGYQFPIASALYLQHCAPGKGLAALYSVDLLGGCAGALLLAGFLIPLYGFWNVALFTAVLNCAAAALAMGGGFMRSRVMVSSG